MTLARRSILHTAVYFPLFIIIASFLLLSCDGAKKVSGKYFGVRNSPVATIEFRDRKAVLTTSGMLRIVFELDYELREGMLYLKDPANGPIPFKIVNSSEILCGDCAYGAKFRKKTANGGRADSPRLRTL